MMLWGRERWMEVFKVGIHKKVVRGKQLARSILSSGEHRGGGLRKSSN